MTLQSADLLLLIGAVLGEVETAGYSRLDVPAPRQKIVQIGPDVSFLNVPYHTELAIASSIDGFIQSLSELTTPSVIPWRESGAQARANHLMFREPLKTNDAINMGEFWSTLANRIPTDTVISMGAGNYTHWVLRHFRFKQLGTLLAPICAPMGYAVPAALAVSRQNPSRLVIAVSGDGCFLMNSQELAVAAHFNANIIYLVVNNNMYGSVRMHQEQRFPERPYATDLTNPDFSALAVAYGIPSTKVDSQPELDSAFSCMVKDASVPRLIEIMTPPDQITPSATLSDIRKSARS
jgi:acetolactate synthase-1/2/3 large subunit